MREVLDENGMAALIAFALNAGQSWQVGQAIHRAALGDAVFAEILDAVLASDHVNAGWLSHVLLRCLAGDDAASVPALFDRAVCGGRTVQDGRTTDILVRLALALPARPESWERIDAAGPAVAAGYWGHMSIGEVPHEVAVEPVLNQLVAAGRVHAALCLAGQRLEGAHLDNDRPDDSERRDDSDHPGGRSRNSQPVATARLIELLHKAVLIDRNDRIDRDTLDFRERVVQIFSHLDDRPEAQDELLHLEWMWYELLEYSDRPPRLLQAGMAEDPGFFMQLLKLAYFPHPDSGVVEERPEDPATIANAVRQAYRLIDEFSAIPGRSDAAEGGGDNSGAIDGQVLLGWVKAVRDAADGCGRRAIADSKIGGMLARAPRIEGQPWPPRAICDVLDAIRSEDLESGFEVGVYNGRGATMRMPTDGGAQERVLVQRYRDDAKQTRSMRVRRMLTRIAERYVEDAVREDQTAERWDW